MAGFVMQTLGCDVSPIYTVRFSTLFLVHTACCSNTDMHLKVIIPRTGNGRAVEHQQRKLKNYTKA